MNESGNQSPPTEPELGRLLEDMVRDGWLLGMNAGLDPAFVRMDAVTGVYNQEYFKALTEEAVADLERGRDPRPGDGPEHGAIAVLSVRILDLEGLGWTLEKAGVEDQLNQVARRLEEVLRADDFVGRTRDDTFSLLLRGCPPPMLKSISDRCLEAVGNTPFDVHGSSVTPRVLAGAAQWESDSGGASDILAASWRTIGHA